MQGGREGEGGSRAWRADATEGRRVHAAGRAPEGAGARWRDKGDKRRLVPEGLQMEGG